MPDDNKVKITPLISDEDRRRERAEARMEANIQRSTLAPATITPLSKKDDLKKKVLDDILNKIKDRERGNRSILKAD